MNRERFDKLVDDAEIMPEIVTERTWREIARVGYQLLDEPRPHNERVEIKERIEWAESMVDHPTREIRQAHMEALGLPETEAGFRVAVDYLLELMTVFADRQEGKIPGGLLLALFKDYQSSGKFKTKEDIYRRIDRMLGQDDDYAKNRLKTINKHRESYKTIPKE